MGRTARFTLAVAAAAALFLHPVRARNTVRVAALRDTVRGHESLVAGELIVQFKATADERLVAGDIQQVGAAGQGGARSARGSGWRSTPTSP